jgi:hypothetical protein
MALLVCSGCCLREIPIIIFLQTTCTSSTSDVPEPRCGHVCRIALERFRLVVCENIDVLYCGICRPAVTPHYIYLTSTIKNASLKIIFFISAVVYLVRLRGWRQSSTCPHSAYDANLTAKPPHSTS